MTRWCVVATCGRVVEPDITSAFSARKVRYCPLHDPAPRGTDVPDSSGCSAFQTPLWNAEQAGQSVIHRDEHRNVPSYVEKMASDLLVPRSPYGVERGTRPTASPVPPTVGRPSRNAPTKREIDLLRGVGLLTGHAWGVCAPWRDSEGKTVPACGEGRLVPRVGDRQRCNLTPGCKGRLIPEETPTPRQVKQRVVTGLFAATRAVMGARRPLKVPYPKLPKEKPHVLPDL